MMHRRRKMERDAKAVVLDAVEDREIVTDLRTAVAQIKADKSVSNRDAKAELRRRFGRGDPDA